MRKNKIGEKYKLRSFVGLLLATIGIDTGPKQNKNPFLRGKENIVEIVSIKGGFVLYKFVEQYPTESSTSIREFNKLYSFVPQEMNQ